MFFVQWLDPRHLRVLTPPLRNAASSGDVEWYGWMGPRLVEFIEKGRLGLAHFPALLPRDAAGSTGLSSYATRLVSLAITSLSCGGLGVNLMAFIDPQLQWREL